MEPIKTVSELVDWLFTNGGAALSQIGFAQ